MNKTALKAIMNLSINEKISTAAGINFLLREAILELEERVSDLELKYEKPDDIIDPDNDLECVLDHDDQ